MPLTFYHFIFKLATTSVHMLAASTPAECLLLPGRLFASWLSIHSCFLSSDNALFSPHLLPCFSGPELGCQGRLLTLSSPHLDGQPFLIPWLSLLLSLLPHFSSISSLSLPSFLFPIPGTCPIFLSPILIVSYNTGDFSSPSLFLLLPPHSLHFPSHPLPFFFMPFLWVCFLPL